MSGRNGGSPSFQAGKASVSHFPATYDKEQPTGLEPSLCFSIVQFVSTCSKNRASPKEDADQSKFAPFLQKRGPPKEGPSKKDGALEVSFEVGK